MSAEERERSHLIRRTVEGSLSQREAAERLGISQCQFKRLVRMWKDQGDAGLVSRQRVRSAHNRLPEATRLQIERLLSEVYADFGPTLAAEKLAEWDGIVVSRETVRRIQTRLKLPKPKKRGEKRVFQVRDRRPHDWFEGHGPRCTLIVFIDDATSWLVALRFVPAECPAGYLAALHDQVLAHGRPLAFYSDRHGIFRVNAKDAQSGDGKAEFGRVVDAWA